MIGRPTLAGVLLLLFVSGLQSQSSEPWQHRIDLEKIGYPAHCDYMFQDEDAYAKRHVAFLDSEHLLVSFPLRSVPCDKNNQPPAEKFRSVIIDTSGRPLRSLDWDRGEDVQAMPDGHILVSGGREARVLNSDLAILQRIDRIPPRWTAAANSCRPGEVKNGELVACLDSNAGQLHIHLGEIDRELRDPLLRKARAAIFPDPQTVLILSDKYWLFLLGFSGETQEIADLHWLVPGWNSSFRWDLATAATRRVLFYSTGARFPITDSSGLGYYLRVAVVDVGSKIVVFRKQYPIDDDVAISPDGRLLAVRTKDHLVLNRLP